MQLRTYDQSSVPSISRGVATVRINRKTGLFSFTKLASEKINLRDGRRLLFHQDQQRPKDWYLEVVSEKNESGFLVRDKKAQGQHAFNSVGLCVTIFEAIEFKGVSASMMIGAPVEDHGRTMFAIITKSLKE